ncbi:metal-dependent hydrolase [Chryseobacterium sp. CBSDS_008]|uniref:metal-dependent hydrolase n=1 Tax=Chryseobacterium sp. CBSDS_008 TaxID=3415265 RepID=UPI003CE7922E
MKIQYLGQNCFLFNDKNKTILSDPFYNYNKATSGFNISDQQIDYILLTHAHGDHIADVDEVLEFHPEASIIGVPEVCRYFKSAKNMESMNLGGSLAVGELTISMVPALHTSSFPDGQYGGVAVGYLLGISEGRNIYLAGDTAVMADMKLFPELFGKIDLSILPIGGRYTMDGEGASFAAAELLKTPQVIGCHFDTFPLIEIDHEIALRHFADRNVELILPELGEVFEF